MIEPQIRIQDLSAWYGIEQALKGIRVDIPARQITVIFGPSGCGKTTLLRSLNRLLEEADGVRVSGQVWLDGVAIYGRNVDVTEVRTRVGMLAPKPFPLPMSIYENVAYGRRIHGLHGRLDKGNGRNLDRMVEHLSAGGWPVGRGQGSATGTRLGAVYRAATTAVPGPCSGRRARSALVRRAHVGPGPDLGAADSRNSS